MKVMIDEVAKQAFALCDKYGINAPSHREMFVCGYRYGMRANPWHKASEVLPEMTHFTTDGDYSNLCVCINESGEHRILVLCQNSEYTYWAYGYDGEGLYDEEMDGGEITHWMEIPELPKEN